MMDVSMVLRTKLKNGTIKRSANGLRLDGDLWITKT